MTQSQSKLVRTLDWLLRSTVLLGLFCLLAVSPAKASLIVSYQVKMIDVGPYPAGFPTGDTDLNPNGGTCFNLQGTSTLGTLSFFTDGVTLDFGTFNTVGGCGAHLQGTTNHPGVAISTTVGTFTDIYGAMCNDQNCNGLVTPAEGDHAVAGWITATRFEISDQFPPPDGHGTNGGSLDYIVEVQNAVPEPGSMVLMGSGLLGLAAFLRKRTSRRS